MRNSMFQLKIKVFQYLNLHVTSQCTMGGLKYPKIKQILITSQGNGVKGWNLTFRLIFIWGIRCSSWKLKFFIILTHMRCHKVPQGPKYPKIEQILITSQGNGVKGWNLTFRLIFIWGIRCSSWKLKFFIILTHMRCHKVPQGPKYPKIEQILITSQGNVMKG